MSSKPSRSAAGKRALVTGATGFVGGHLARALLHAGWEVHVVLRPSSDRSALRDVLDRLVCHVHDGTTDGLVSLVRAARPGVVFHLASLFVAEHRPEHVEPLVRSNLLFGSQLLEAMTACDVSCLVNTGTSWQHYRGRLYSPVCLYAATKQAYEAILQFYVETGDLRVVTLELTDTYGPGDRRPKLLGVLGKSLDSGEPLAMSAGDQWLDLVHIDDVVAAYRAAARRVRSFQGARHERYSVRSGAPVRLKELVRLYAALAGTALNVSWGARPYRKREAMTRPRPGVRLAGWRPAIPLRKGLRRLIARRDRGDR